jgi:hypothetical protein
MIIKFHERYSKIAKENNLDQELIASVADTIFRHSRSRLENFTELRYEIKGIGTWNLRETKFIEFYKDVWTLINRGWENVRRAYFEGGKLEWLEMMKDKVLKFKEERSEIQKRKITLIKQYAEQNAKLPEK